MIHPFISIPSLKLKRLCRFIAKKGAWAQAATLVGISLIVAMPHAFAVMYSRDTGDTKSRSLALLPPFESKAFLTSVGCTAVLIAPDTALSAAHCVNAMGSANGTTGGVSVTWNGQAKSGTWTKIGDDLIVVKFGTVFTSTAGKMTAPYAGSTESGRLIWKVAYGGSGVLGPGATVPTFISDNIFRAMSNRVGVDSIASPPPAVDGNYVYYDFDGPPTLPSGGRATTLYEGGTAPGDSGGPLYMFENGRWWVIGVTTGPLTGFYRDGRVRSGIADIRTISGHSWAVPVTAVLEMKWVAHDLVTSIANGAAVTTWPRQGGADAWTTTAGDGGVGTPTLTHAATPQGKAAVSFGGTSRLGLPAASNAVATETSFSVAMVFKANAVGVGTQTNWLDNTGLIDADETGTVNDWGLALASTGRSSFGLGNANSTAYQTSASLADGVWHVLVATWDGSEVSGDAVGTDKNMRLYVDTPANVVSRAGPEFIDIARTAASLTLGGSRATARYLNGSIAEVRLYKGALDEVTVTGLLTELRGTYIAQPLALSLTRPTGNRAAVFLGQGLSLEGALTGVAPSVAITQTSGPATAVITPANALPARISFPATGVYQYNVTATDGAETSVKTITVEVLSTGGISATQSLALANAWTGSDLGDVTATGSQTTTGGTASMTGAGAGFQEVSDSHRFVWQPLVGNGSITARVASFDSGAANEAFAGIMLRGDLTRESMQVAATVRKAGGVRFSRRGEDAAYVEPTDYSLNAPYWLRVKRVGNSFSSFRSPDGVTWTEQGTAVTIATMPTAAQWGLAVTANDANEISTVAFTNVLLEPLAGQGAAGTTWTGGDIGTASSISGTVTPGTHSGSGSAFTLNGGGTAFGGMADRGYFLSQTYSGDAQLTARVVSQEQTSGTAKAGVMVRADTTIDSANAFTCVTPLGGIAAQRRAVAGGNTSIQNAGTFAYTAPYWLRLTRSGSNFTCFRSVDGTTWAQLGPVETITGMPASLFAGLILSSADNAVTTTAALDNITIVETNAAPTGAAFTLASGQNPSVANNFTLMASSVAAPTWSWEKVSGPGNLTFSTQNSTTPKVAFTAAGSYVVRTNADTGSVKTFAEQTLAFSLDARWNFNTATNLEGWATTNVNTTTVASGLLTGTASSADPQVSKLAAMYVSGDLAKHLLVRYRGSSASSTQWFWGRVNAGNFAGGRTIVANYSPANTFKTLLFDVTNHADWKAQTLIDLRFDPSGSTGATFEIDWFALSDGDYDDDGLSDLLEGTTDSDNDGLSNLEDTDSDNDSLPDAYETANGLSTISSSDAAQDKDNDGQTNAAEYLAGTNPSIANDVLRVATTDRVGNAMNLTIAGKAGRRYTLERSLTLTGTWTPVAMSAVLSADAALPLSDTNAPAGAGFYRVSVEWP